MQLLTVSRFISTPHLSHTTHEVCNGSDQPACHNFILCLNLFLPQKLEGHRITKISIIILDINRFLKLYSQPLFISMYYTWKQICA